MQRKGLIRLMTVEMLQADRVELNQEMIGNMGKLFKYHDTIEGLQEKMQDAPPERKESLQAVITSYTESAEILARRNREIFEEIQLIQLYENSFT